MVLDYDPETKRQSEEWHTKSSPCPEKACMSRSRVKTMIIVFSDSHSIVHKEFVPPVETVKSSLLQRCLGNNSENGSRVSEGTLQMIGCCCNTIMHQLTLRFREFLVKKNIPVLPHPPYSPDLAPCDFYLFPKLKSKLKGHHFGTMGNIQKIVTNELNTLMENDFQYCYDQWKKHLNHCVTSQGSYFEGDNL